MILNFFIRFATRFGQTLYVSGNNEALGNDDPASAVPLQYFNEELWRGRVEIPSVATQVAALEYRYIFREADGSTIIEWGNDKQVDLAAYNTAELVLFDTWNY